MAFPIETFADVLHHLIDRAGFGDHEAAQAHAVVDGASGARTPEPEQAAAPAPAPDAPPADAPAEPAAAGDAGPTQ